MSANKLTPESPLKCLAFSEADASLPGLRTVKLSPWGNVKGKNGEFQIDDEAARSILAEFHEHGTAIPIDREHETIAPPVGGARGAIGWVESVFVESGRGLFGLVKWSDAGRDLIRSEAFRYISPVFMVNPDDRRAMILHSAAITNKPAIPRMERLAASEKLFTEQMAMADTGGDPRALIEEMAQLLGVGAGDDPLATLAAIRDAIKNKMAESKSGEKSGTETVANAERVAPELMAMREENQTLRIQLQKQELTEFLAPYVAKGVLSNEHDRPYRGRADYRQMMALAESNRDVAKAWLDERLGWLPKQFQTEAPLDRGTQSRGILIANAEREFDATPGHQKATSKRAFVNMRLRDANLMALSEDEAKGYVLVG